MSKGDPRAGTRRQAIGMSTELAEAVRHTVAIREVMALLAWVGPGRPVTRNGYLGVREAREVVAALDLRAGGAVWRMRRWDDNRALIRLWHRAQASRLLIIDGGEAWAEQTTLADVRDDVLLTAWLGILAHEVRRTRTTRRDPGSLAWQAECDAVVALVDAVRAGDDVDEDRWLDSQVERRLARAPAMLDDDDRWRSWMYENVADHLVRLRELGVLEPRSDGPLCLTSLGAWGSEHSARRHERDVLERERQQEQVTPLTEVLQHGSYHDLGYWQVWVMARGTERAARDLVDLMRNGTAVQRGAASFVGPKVARTEVRALLEAAPVPAEHRRGIWPLVDRAALLLSLHDRVPRRAWDSVTKVTSLNQVLASSHPDLVEVLDGLTRRHPDPAVREAAASAAFERRRRAAGLA